MVALPSIHEVRALLIFPLYVHEEDAFGDCAYVMADGSAYFERLRAASDLYHLNRIPVIYILDEQSHAGFNFSTKRLESVKERAIAYLQLLGVPRDAIRTVSAQEDGLMGSLTESIGVKQTLPENIKQIVVITSAPHTRRSQLCFKRTLSPNISIRTYSATIPLRSAELHLPIFHEYVKLVIYYLLA